MRSMQEMETVQRAFQSSFASKPGVVGIGIGANSDMTDLALRVFVDSPTTADDLPNQFNGVEVVTDVVGKIKAY